MIADVEAEKIDCTFQRNFERRVGIRIGIFNSLLSGILIRNKPAVESRKIYRIVIFFRYPFIQRIF